MFYKMNLEKKKKHPEREVALKVCAATKSEALAVALEPALPL